MKRPARTAGTARTAAAGARRAAGRDRGSVAVELALLLPVLLLVLIGTMEYGWLYLKTQQIGAAARNAARVGIVEGATNAEVQASVDAVMAEADLDGSGYSTTISPDVAAAAAGTTVTVTVSVPASALALTAFPLPRPDTLTGRSSMVKEGN